MVSIDDFPIGRAIPVTKSVNWFITADCQYTVQRAVIVGIVINRDYFPLMVSGPEQGFVYCYRTHFRYLCVVDGDGERARITCAIKSQPGYCHSSRPNREERV